MSKAALDGDGRRKAPLIEEYKRLLPDLHKEFDELIQSGVKNEEDFFTSARGLKCATRIFLPPTEKRNGKAVVFAHGFTDDTRWLETAHFYKLVSHGFTVLAMDFEGHGLSDGSFGGIMDLNKVVDDMEEFINLKAKTIDSPNWFLLGHSMGGMVAIQLALRAQKDPKLVQFSGVILSAPLIKLSGTPSNKLLLFFLMSICRLLPNLRPNDFGRSNFNIGTICKDIKLGELSLKNPAKALVQPKLGTIRSFYQITESTYARILAGEMKTPFFVLHGRKDVVTSCQASEALFECSNAENKQIFVDEEAFHGMLTYEFSAQRDTYWNKIFLWIDSVV